MSLNLLVIRSSNPEKLARLYQHFGLSFHYHQHGNGPFHYSSEQNGFVLEIYPLLQKQSFADDSIRLGFKVKNLKQLMESISLKDIIIIKKATQSEWGYSATIKDFENRKIDLLEN